MELSCTRRPRSHVSITLKKHFLRQTLCISPSGQQKKSATFIRVNNANHKYAKSQNGRSWQVNQHSIHVKKSQWIANHKYQQQHDKKHSLYIMLYQVFANAKSLMWRNITYSEQKSIYCTRSLWISRNVPPEKERKLYASIYTICVKARTIHLFIYLSLVNRFIETDLVVLEHPSPSTELLSIFFFFRSCLWDGTCCVGASSVRLTLSILSSYHCSASLEATEMQTEIQD